MADIKSNLSQFVPREVNVTINAVKDPKAFGNQLVDSAKQYVKTTLLNAVDLIKKEILIQFFIFLFNHSLLL